MQMMKRSQAIFPLRSLRTVTGWRRCALSVLLSFGAVTVATAQSTLLQTLRSRGASGQGTVTVTQSAEIERLVSGVKAAPKTTAQPVTPARTAGSGAAVKAEGSHPSHTAATAAGRGTTPVTPAKHPEGARTHSEPAEHHTASGKATAHRTEPVTHHAATAEAAAPEVHLHVNRLRYKARGFRICIFTGGNSRADRQRALEMGRKCREKFPELAAYTSFSAPRWVTHVGDFRTRAEAQKYVSRIRRARLSYEVRIVGSEVNLPVE